MISFPKPWGGCVWDGTLQQYLGHSRKREDNVSWQFFKEKKFNNFSRCQRTDTTCVHYERRSDKKVMNMRSTLVPALTYVFLLVPLGLSWSFISMHTGHLAFKSRSWEMLSAMKGVDTICTRRLGLSLVYIRIFLFFPMLAMPAGVPRAYVRDPWPRH